MHETLAGFWAKESFGYCYYWLGYGLLAFYPRTFGLGRSMKGRDVSDVSLTEFFVEVDIFILVDIELLAIETNWN